MQKERSSLLRSVASDGGGDDIEKVKDLILIHEGYFGIANFTHDWVVNCILIIVHTRLEFLCLAITCRTTL